MRSRTIAPIASRASTFRWPGGAILPCCDSRRRWQRGCPSGSLHRLPAGLPPPNSLAPPSFFSSFSISAIICSSPCCPPRCASICGFILCIICATVAASMLCKSICPLPIFLFFFMVFCIVVCMSLNCSSSSTTSCGWCPEPRAILTMRDGAKLFVSSSSASVIESIIVIHFFIRTPLSWKSSPDMPGNWFIMLPRGPILSTAWNCSRMSRSVH
mmetsp:Transcript_3861/g.8132  ORF Transcript_3861/g.8132 Transcript_3861/m.8132 type:complete len:214 (-) Transcript_3861:546-1187(-)